MHFALGGGSTQEAVAGPLLRSAARAHSFPIATVSAARFCFDRRGTLSAARAVGDGLRSGRGIKPVGAGYHVASENSS